MLYYQFQKTKQDHFQSLTTSTLKEAIIQDTINTVKATQKELLQAAAATATKITETGIREDTIDEEVGMTHDDLASFSNNINRSNFDFCRQVETLWKRARRAVEENNRTKAAEAIEKGKKLTRKRMKCFKMADREGWDVPLA